MPDSIEGLPKLENYDIVIFDNAEEPWRSEEHTSELQSR
jgi:hypothetical protein